MHDGRPARIWRHWMMCWQQIVWRVKLLMSGWRAWHNELEFLVSVMVGTSLSYHSLRVTTSPGMRHAGNWELASTLFVLLPSSCFAYDRISNFSDDSGVPRAPLPTDVAMTFFSTALAFVVTLGLLIVFHEFGHYLVARWCGVKVLRFSIGFGQPLLSEAVGKRSNGMGDRCLSPWAGMSRCSTSAKAAWRPGIAAVIQPQARSAPVRHCRGRTDSQFSVGDLALLVAVHTGRGGHEARYRYRYHPRRPPRLRVSSGERPSRR